MGKDLNDLGKVDSRLKPLILVDGMNVSMRYHYGLSLKDKTGSPTGMLYGVLKLVLDLRNEYSGSEIIFLWEGYGSKRKAMSTDYKSDRKKTDTTIRDCVEELREALQLIGVKQSSHYGLEADDLCGWYVNKHKGRKHIVLISNDRDWWQFVYSDNIVVRTSHNIVHTKSKLKEALSFDPERIGLLKSLIGDSSDNVEGIYRFPHALGDILVQNCSSIEEILSYKLPDGYSKWQITLNENADKLRQNAELVIYNQKWIHTRDIRVVEPVTNNRKLKSMLEKHDMKKMVEKLKL